MVAVTEGGLGGLTCDLYVARRMHMDIAEEGNGCP